MPGDASCGYKVDLGEVTGSNTTFKGYNFPETYFSSYGLQVHASTITVTSRRGTANDSAAVVGEVCSWQNLFGVMIQA